MIISIVAALAIALDLVGILYAQRQARNFYTISPGTAPMVAADGTCPTTGPKALVLPSGKPCVRLVLPSAKVSKFDGSILMVDVLVGQTSPQDWLLNKLGLLHHFDDGTVLVPASSILGTTPASQLVCQDDQDMSDSTSSASVVALRRLGYQVRENDLGAQVYEVAPGTPAARAGLQCNDLLTAIDGAPVHTDVDLVRQIRTLAPGVAAHLTVMRIERGKQVPVTVTARLGSTPALGGEPANPRQAFLGIETQTRTTYTFPYDVTIDVGNIGGPSAGLALTLGMLDALSGGNLTGGHRIAATGTIDSLGNVGDVGGVAQKTVAVRRAGAQLFFVPPQELQAAKSEAGSMKVYAVSTLQQALNYLRSLGGHVPAPASQNGAG